MNYNPMSLKDVHGLCPELDIPGAINSLTNKSGTGGTEVDRVIVASPNYLSRLSKILQSASPATIQNFFIWKVVQSLAGYTEAVELLAYKRFYNELEGKVCWCSDNWSQLMTQLCG